MQVGGSRPAELRSAAEAAIACVEPYVSSAAACRLGLDGNTTAAYFAENAALEFAEYATVPMAGRRCIVHRGYALREAIIGIVNELDIPASCHSFHRNSVYNFKCASAADAAVSAPSRPLPLSLPPLVMRSQLSRRPPPPSGRASRTCKVARPNAVVP